MAALPVNSTGRVFVDYVANGRQHTCQMRYSGSGAPDVGFLEGIDDVMIACNPWMPTDWEFVGWRYVIEGGSVSVDLTGTLTAFDGAQTPVTGEAPAFMSVPGRSIGGRRVRFTLLGFGISAAEALGYVGDYRITSGENVVAAAILAAVSGSPFVCIDGGDPIWKDYINIGYNAYWQRAVRT